MKLHRAVLKGFKKKWLKSLLYFAGLLFIFHTFPAVGDARLFRALFPTLANSPAVCTTQGPGWGVINLGPQRAGGGSFPDRQFLEGEEPSVQDEVALLSADPDSPEQGQTAAGNQNSLKNFFSVRRISPPDIRLYTFRFDPLFVLNRTFRI